MTFYKMFTIEMSDYRALYIDHKKLITTLYEEDLDDSVTYRLRTGVFNFHPKPVKPISVNKSDRKRKFEQNFNIEMINLKKECQALLRELVENDVVTRTVSNGDIERIWEESTSFPQFRGENPLNKFQIVTLNSKEYMIPPRCRFFNYDILKFKQINFVEPFDFIVMDPPWRNKYIRRIKRARKVLGYKMLDVDLLSTIPLDKYITRESIVAVWCTNSAQHQNKLIEKCFPQWDLCLLHKITWLKLDTTGDLIHEVAERGKKQPYEILFVAHHKDDQRDMNDLKKLKFILSIPSIIHSHKPPLLDIFRKLLPNHPRCLELFARYLLPGFTSVGLEVVKLMDTRLYMQKNETIISSD